MRVKLKELITRELPAKLETPKRAARQVRLTFPLR